MWVCTVFWITDLIRVRMFVVLIRVGVLTLVETEMGVGVDEINTFLGVRGEVVEEITTWWLWVEDVLIDMALVRVGVVEKTTKAVVMIRGEAIALHFEVNYVGADRVLNLKNIYDFFLMMMIYSCLATFYCIL